MSTQRTTHDWDQVNSRFENLPRLRLGESKDIRIVDENYVLVHMIPSLYSYTNNRYSLISGTDSLRLQSFKVLNDVLVGSGVETAIVHIGHDYYVTRRLIHAGEDYVPPIEVVVKGRHVGTPKHTLYKIQRYKTRSGHHLESDAAHTPYAQFDYTNPLTDDSGNRLRDECIPRGLANFYLDAERAESTAIKAYRVLFEYLSERGVRLDDICFKIDHTGERIFGEVSQDCLRAVYVDESEDFYSSSGQDASKDTFRAGSNAESVYRSYQRFVDLVKGPATRPTARPLNVTPEQLYAWSA